ncbi:MAG TPA: GFA family protein [Sphingomonas sp.]|nr:GFA family protein [Sphingomonas sp.]
MSGVREGGCLCGDIRYQVEWPASAVVTCSCRNCQKQAGSALSVVLVFPREAVRVSGELSTYEDRGTSGQTIYRRFCPRCGSPVLTDTPRAEKQGIIFVKGGTLDDVSDLKPTAHYWTASAQPWMRLPEGDQQIERE